MKVGLTESHLGAGLGFMRLEARPVGALPVLGAKIPVVLGVFLFLAPAFSMQRARAPPLDDFGQKSKALMSSRISGLTSMTSSTFDCILIFFLLDGR